MSNQIFPIAPDDNTGNIPPSHIQLVFEMLCSNFSPTRISKLLKKNHNLDIPAKDITDYYASIDPNQILPPGKMRDVLNNLDVQIDVMGELATQIRWLKDRLEFLQEQYATTQDKTLIVDITRFQKQYVNLLDQYLGKQIVLGDVIISKDQVPEDPATQVAKKTVKEFLKLASISDDDDDDE